MSLPLRILFLVNAVATLAAALVLFLAPNLIPAVAGAAVPPESLLVARLLGAYEAGLAVLCTLVLLRPEPATVRLGVWVMIAVHAAAALAEAITLVPTLSGPHPELVEGPSPVVLANLALRLALVVLFALFGLRRTAAPSTGVSLPRA